MTNEEARPATSSVLSRREERERLGASGARGDHLLRKRAAREVAAAADPEIRLTTYSPLRRTWKCCLRPQEFPLGEESADIHFCSFADCQHVMCAEHAHTVGVRYVKFPGRDDLVFGHYFCWHHKNSDLYERRLPNFQENDSAQFRRWRRISNRFPANVNIFEGVEESVLAVFPGTPIDPEDDIHVDVISRDVLQGQDSEGHTLLPPIPLDTGLRSGFTCCKCGARDTVEKPLVENCWFNDPKCLHRLCQEHCKNVGYYNPGGCIIEWCNCHDAVCLPCPIEDWERNIPDSDGEYDDGLQWTLHDDVTWNSEEAPTSTST
eukprot:1405388-Amphidinium_carterae.1